MTGFVCAKTAPMVLLFMCRIAYKKGGPYNDRTRLQISLQAILD